MYAKLRDELEALSTTPWTERQAELASHTGPAALSPLDAATLTSHVKGIWSSIPHDASSSRHAEVVRSTLDLVGRDIAVRPVVDGKIAEPLDDSSDAEKAAFQTALQDRLDIVLTLYEVVYEDLNAPSLEPGAVFIPLLEEFVELLLVSTWHELFAYVETRAPRFTKNMPASKGKALPLLRTINAFLRFLSHTPEDLTLRGRVQLFASRAISVADKSATNLRGEYSQVTTTWEEAEPEADGDVQMDDGEKPVSPDFYSTLWSLQQFFAHPPSLDGPATGDPPQTPFEVFRAKSDLVLARLFEETSKERVLFGKNPERKRKRDDFDVSPRYLTARSLMEYEIADPSFRRQLLLQYFILFQFLLNLTPGSALKQQSTGGMPKTFVIEGDNQTWIKQTVTRVREELCRMRPGGREFDAIVVQLMDRERRYAQWKNEGCPESEWELPPADLKDAASAAQKWKRHCAPARKWPYALGTAPLSRMWEKGYKSMDDFFDHPVKRQTVFELEEELTRIEVEEEDDRGFGKEPSPELLEKKRTVKWLALRAARREYPRLVAVQGTEYDLHTLVKTIKERERKSAETEVDDGDGDGEGDADAEAEPEAEAEAEAETAETAEVAEGEKDAVEAGKGSNGGSPQAEAEEAEEGKGEEVARAVEDDPPAGDEAIAETSELAAEADPQTAGTPIAQDSQVGTPNGHDGDVQMEAEENDLTPPPEEDAE